MSDMYRLFTSFFDTPTHAAATARRWVPAMDLVEGDEEYVIKADLPGVRPADVSLDVADGVLTIAGQRSSEHSAKRGGYVRVERATGRFARSLTLPKGVDAEAIAASFADGVLTVRIPKPAAIKPRRIEISVGEEPQAIEAVAGETAEPTAA
jgi:HSP20 family protein